MADHPTFLALIQEWQDIVSERNELRAKVVRLEETKQLAIRGTKNSKRLTPREVENIRALSRSGYSQREIADIYDINRGTVCRIVNGVYHKKAGD